jgi:DNA-binding transcriptional MerR regulator
VSELGKRVNRSPDTIKRWVDEGLLPCDRDEKNQRRFTEASVERCLLLARLSIEAQAQNRKLTDLAAEVPEQLQLLPQGQVSGDAFTDLGPIRRKRPL